MNELKPCPFCGDTELEGGKPFPSDRNSSEWIVRCGAEFCGAEIRFKRKEHAIAAWNSRKTDHAQDGQDTSSCIYSEDRGLRTVGPHGGLKESMPSPNAFNLLDPQFNAIWEAIKTWDVNVPEYYVGYAGANGSHVMLILNALRALNVVRPSSPDGVNRDDTAETAFWNFDARRKGYGRWLGMAQTERDAFKDEVRKAFVDKS